MDNIEIQIKFSAECYLQQDNKKYISFVNYFLRKEIQGEKYDYELEIKDYGQIIWANDTSLLTSDGQTIYQEGYPYTLDQKGNKILSK